MFDPSLGRWITEDPIDFAGRDVNLFRAVGNNPVNRVDPSGLSDEPPYPKEPGTITKSFDNCECNLAQVFGRGIIGGKPRSKWITLAARDPKEFLDDGFDLKLLAPSTTIPKDLITGGAGTNIARGTHAFFRCSEGDQKKTFGTGGCGPCVGFVVANEDGTGAVFHFGPGCEVHDTLRKYMWFTDKKKPKMYLFGGEEGDGKAASQAVYNDVINFYRSRMRTKDNCITIIDSSGLLIGSNSTPYVRPTDMVGRGDLKK